MPNNENPNGGGKGYPMIGLTVGLGLLSCLVFDGQIVLPLLMIFFVFRGVPFLHRRVISKTFDDPVQRYALLAAITFFVLGVLEELATL